MIHRQPRTGPSGRVLNLTLCSLIFCTAAVLGQKSVEGTEKARQERAAQSRVKPIIKQLTPRVRYKRIQPKSSIQQTVLRLLRESVGQAGPKTPRILSSTTKEGGFVSARLDPLSVMGFAVLERNAGGEQATACTKLPDPEAGSRSVSARGGRQ